jgi:Cysteine dioxygenase type I
MAQRLEVGKWVEKLAAVPAKDFTLNRIDDFMGAFSIQPETLAPYLFYCHTHYTRNLIFKCDLFEIIAICWEVGQCSAIHNHRDQNCWMAVPIGKLRVENFRVEHLDRARGSCKLVPSDVYDMDAEHHGTVQPAEPVHRVLNLAEFAQRATSVHVYSKPYSSCEVYSLEKGTYMDVPLHYSSEYGEFSPEEKLV